MRNLMRVLRKKVNRQLEMLIEFKDLDLGYYLVDSSVGVLCVLTTYELCGSC